jgi:hypothetical protein
MDFKEALNEHFHSVQIERSKFNRAHTETTDEPTDPKTKYIITFMDHEYLVAVSPLYKQPWACTFYIEKVDNRTAYYNFDVHCPVIPEVKVMEEQLLELDGLHQKDRTHLSEDWVTRQ